MLSLSSLPADVLWGSFVTHSMRGVTNEPQRTSAGRLVPFWSPYLQKNIDALPMSCRKSPYEERLTMLRWINQGGLIYLC